jgi:hypothetical protein
MAECEARMQPRGLVAYLTCDLDKSEHAGLNHHDGTFGIWWNACSLEDHGHAGPALTDVTERRRAFRAGLRADAGKVTGDD